MTAAFLTLLPVFVVILAGFVLRRSNLVGETEWAGVDHLCYMLLFPAIIFREIAGADFSGMPVWQMAFAMILAITTMFVLLLVLRPLLYRLLQIDGPQFSSLFQGATRWHTFIGLAIIPAYFGPSYIAIGAVAAAAMIPLLNVVNVAVISVYATGHGPNARIIARSILVNPFVLSSVGGILWKLTGLSFPAIGLQVLDMIGRGALGLALLTVGAGLQIGGWRNSTRAVIAATVLKLIVMPAFMAFWLYSFGVSGEVAAVALLMGSVPTGSGAYVLARKMGGDAPLVANILTAQVIAAAVTIPIVVAFFAR
jgi:predicted permease